jgi:hypothetical protein
MLIEHPTSGLAPSQARPTTFPNLRTHGTWLAGRLASRCALDADHRSWTSRPDAGAVAVLVEMSEVATVITVDQGVITALTPRSPGHRIFIQGPEVVTPGTPV